MPEDDWDPLTRVNMPGKHKAVIKQLVREGYFDSVSDAIRTSMTGLKAGGTSSIPDFGGRSEELKHVYDSVSKPRSEKVLEFFFDLTHLLNEFEDVADERNLEELDDEIEQYSEKYFRDFDIMDYREVNSTIKQQFLYDTVDLVMEFVETDGYTVSLGEEPHDELEEFMNTYLEESHTPHPPYLKFKL